MHAISHCHFAAVTLKYNPRNKRETVQLKAYTGGGGQLIFKVLDYEADVEKVVASAFASTLAAAADLKEEGGCLAWANAGGCIYTPEQPDTVYPNCEGCEGSDCLANAECTAEAVSVGAIKEIDAIAEASAHLSPPHHHHLCHPLGV